MTNAIWKFPLATTDRQIVNLPVGAKVLAVQTQFDEPQLWALVDVDAGEKTSGRAFLTYGTGHQHEGIDGDYVGTYQLRGGCLVFHVFEVPQ